MTWARYWIILLFVLWLLVLKSWRIAHEVLARFGLRNKGGTLILQYLCTNIMHGRNLVKSSPLLVVARAQVILRPVLLNFLFIVSWRLGSKTNLCLEVSLCFQNCQNRVAALTFLDALPNCVRFIVILDLVLVVL